MLKDCITKVQEKKKKVVVLCSRPQQNVKLGPFALYSCNDCKEISKISVIHVQSCRFANLNLLLFDRCRRRRSGLSSPLSRGRGAGGGGRAAC